MQNLDGNANGAGRQRYLGNALPVCINLNFGCHCLSAFGKQWRRVVEFVWTALLLRRLRSGGTCRPFYFDKRFSLLLLAACWSSPACKLLAQDIDREYFALVVGVGHYPPTKFRNLTGAEPDAVELAKTLVNKGFRSENVTILTNTRGASVDPRFAPTADNILREVDLLLDNRKPNDIVLIALAGHGLQLKGQPYVFCPFDADPEQKKNLISIEHLYDQLKVCKAEFKLLLVDACREETLAPPARNSLPDEVASVTRPVIAEPPGGVAAFFSCTRGQVARERTDKGADGKEVSHGLFFHAVIRAMNGAAADQQGEVTLPDLEKFVKRDVEAYSRVTYSAKQFPELLNQTRGLPSLIPKQVSRPTQTPSPSPTPSPGSKPNPFVFPGSKSAPKKNEISLIDRTTLKGWTPRIQGTNSYWEVNNGVILRTGPGPDLVSTQVFRDFDLHLDFKLPKKGNSGVYLRGRYEVQLVDSAFVKLDGTPERPNGQCGAIYSHIAPDSVPYLGSDQWNTLDVRLEGMMVTVRMNDVTVINRKRITSATPGALEENREDQSSAGPILLQASFTPGVAFRDIKIIRLNEDLSTLK